jgi:hypothetical protein
VGLGVGRGVGRGVARGVAVGTGVALGVGTTLAWVPRVSTGPGVALGPGLTLGPGDGDGSRLGDASGVVDGSGLGDGSAMGDDDGERLGDEAVGEADGVAPGISAPTPSAMATTRPAPTSTAATAMRTPLSFGSSIRGAPCRVPRSRLTVLPSTGRGTVVPADHRMLEPSHEDVVDPG